MFVSLHFEYHSFYPPLHTAAVWQMGLKTFIKYLWLELELSAAQRERPGFVEWLGSVLLRFLIFDWQEIDDTNVLPHLTSLSWIHSVPPHDPTDLTDLTGSVIFLLRNDGLNTPWQAHGCAKGSSYLSHSRSAHTWMQILFSTCLHYTESKAGAGAGVFSSGQLTAAMTVTAIRHRRSVCQRTVH